MRVQSNSLSVINRHSVRKDTSVKRHTTGREIVISELKSLPCLINNSDSVFGIIGKYLDDHDADKLDRIEAVFSENGDSRGISGLVNIILLEQKFNFKSSMVPRCTSVCSNSMFKPTVISILKKLSWRSLNELGNGYISLRYRGINQSLKDVVDEAICKELHSRPEWKLEDFDLLPNGKCSIS